MIILLLFLSFYLEGLFSMFLNVSFLIPLFTLMTLIIIYPFMINYERKYYIICLFTGLLYDIAYTNTLFLNASLFLLLGYITTKLYYHFKTNILNTNIVGFIIILIYRTLTYFLLLFINYIDNDYYELINSILNSILLNLFYITSFYIIVNRLFKKGIYQNN